VPSLIQRRGKKRWRGSITVRGITRQKLFPDSSKESEREAGTWEAATKKELLKYLTASDYSKVNLSKWSEDYLSEMKSRLSKGTVQEKIRAFKTLLDHLKCGPDYPVESITIDHARSYLKHQNDTRSGYAANKDRKNMSTAWEWGKVFINDWPNVPNPFKAIPKFKEVRAPRYIPPVDDFWKLYDSITDLQDRAMLMTFLHLAARRNEIFNLKVEDLDFEHRRVCLWTNKRDGGREFDWLPMTQELASSLLKWIEKKIALSGVDTRHIFVSLNKTPVAEEYYGKPFTVRQHFMRRSCERAGVDPFGFHAIRHLTASILYSAGYNVSHIQMILRHKNPHTTERYLKTLGIESVRESLEEGLKRKGEVIRLEEKKVS
jgi:integrase